MLEQSIKNPSLIPNWFVFSSAGKVTGIRDVNGFIYEFVGSSEKGEDGQTPLLRINAANNFKWEVSYDGTVWNEVQVSPAASGMVGPQGETGPSGNSIVLQSAEQVEGGIQVTLAWGENESSAFLIPSGTPGSSYTFDQTTTSGDGSTDPIGVNTNVIATKDDLDDYVKQDDLLPESGISGDYVSQDNKYHFGITTSGMAANKQYAFTTSGWKEVTAQGSIAAGTDLVLDNGVMKVNTNGVANAAGMAFVEGIDTVASGVASHAEGKETSAFGDYSHVGGYRNKDFKIEGLIGANHVEGAYNQTSAVYSHVEGHANTLYGYGVHMQGGYNEFFSHNLSADKSNPEGRWNIWGQSIEGMANKTTTEPTSGTPGQSDFGYVHGGILKVIGNGTRTTDEHGGNEQIIRNDALILYRDGSMWVQGPISANGVELGNYSPTLPLNIGNNNTVTNDSIGAIGNNCNVGTKSVALSYLGASAYSNSMAVGDGNFASANSLAMGWGVTAKQYGVIFGKGNASNPSEANNYSIAAGDAVFAYNYSQAFGRGLVASGNSNGKGLMAIGGWNKTQSNALFVIGNGTNSDDAHRSDALVVDYAGNTTLNGSLSARVANGKNIIAVASAASLIGASRQTSANYGVNNTAIGTTWFGVGGDGMHQGFIKYSNGGNIGDLDTASTVQLNFRTSTDNYDSVQVLQNGNSVGYLIPAQIHQGSYSPTSADGILHIVVES